MTSNQAACWNAVGSPLQVGPADTPIASPTQIVVRNHALAINPADWKLQLGSFLPPPVILGEDIAGEVISIGSEVTRFKVGDRVLSHVDQLATRDMTSGGFQLFTAAPARTSAIIPDSVTYIQACVLPLALDTALVGLVDILKLGYPTLNPEPTGATVLVWGGASSVGTAAIQLAVAAGAKVITTASKRNHDLVRGLGACATVDYKDADAVEQIREAVRVHGGGKLAGVLDAISEQETYRDTVLLAMELANGQLATMLPPPKGPQGLTAVMVLPIRPDLQERMWREYVTPALEQGKLKCAPEPTVIGRGLESIQSALDMCKAGVSAKKLVVELP